MESFRSRYVRTVVLLFSVGAKATTASAAPIHGVTFRNEHLVHNKDSIYYPDRLPSSTIKHAGSSSSSTSVWTKLGYNLFANDDEYDSRLRQQLLCDIGDGYVYRKGEVLLTFETRCGSREHFPCYCDPALDPPIVCPYCGFHAPSNGIGNARRKQHSRSDTFFCLKDGETSDPFVGREGIHQRCSCRHISDGRTDEAVSSCRPATPATRPPLVGSTDTANQGGEPSAAPVNHGTSTNHESNDNHPVVSGDTGGEDETSSDDVQSVQVIEDTPVFENRDSGDEVEDSNANETARPTARPTTARPTQPKTEHNDPVVGEDTEESSKDSSLDAGETFVETQSEGTTGAPDVVEVENVTEAGDPPSKSSKQTIVIDDISDAVPREFDTTTSTNETPDAVESKDETATPPGESSKTKTIIDDVTDATPTVYEGTTSVVTNADENADVCELTIDDKGTIKTFQRGQSYGDYVPNRCNDIEKYPCRCNPDLYNQIECPYCSFVTGNGGILCAEDGESVTFLSPDPTERKIETCKCFVPNPGHTPIEACSVEEYKAIDDPEEKSSDTYQDLYPEREPPAGRPGASATDGGDGGDDPTGANNNVATGPDGSDGSDGGSGDAESASQTGVSNNVNAVVDDGGGGDGDVDDAGSVTQTGDNNDMNTDADGSDGDGGDADSVTQTTSNNDINTDGANIGGGGSADTDSSIQTDVSNDASTDADSGDGNSSDAGSGDMGSGDMGSSDGPSSDMGSGDMGSGDLGSGDGPGSYSGDEDDDWDDGVYPNGVYPDGVYPDGVPPDGVIQNLEARSANGGESVRRPRMAPHDTPRPSLSPVVTPALSPIEPSPQPSVRGSTAFERVRSGGANRNGGSTLQFTAVCLLGILFATIQF